MKMLGNSFFYKLYSLLVVLITTVRHTMKLMTSFCDCWENWGNGFDEFAFEFLFDHTSCFLKKKTEKQNSFKADDEIRKKQPITNIAFFMIKKNAFARSV